MFLNWLANKVIAWLWPYIAYNVKMMVEKMIDSQPNEMQQRMHKWMEEMSDSSRTSYKQSLDTLDLLKRQTNALEKLAGIN